MASTSIIFDLIANDRASADFDRVGDSADRSGGKLAKMGQLGKAAALGLAAGTGLAVVGLAKLAQGAAEDEAAQKKLARAITNATGATGKQVAGVEDWITAQGKALGVADDELRPALQRLVGATKDVGDAQKLASLAMDVSAGTGMSLEATSKALAKAQNGQVAGLSKLGISTKDANGKVIDFEEAQKRLAALHNGQAAEGANTLEGKMGRLKLALSEAGESVGAKLLPPLTNLVTWFVDEGLPKMEKFGAWLAETLPPIFERVKGVIVPFFSTLKSTVTDNFGAVQSIFQSAVSIITSLWSTFGDTITAYIGPAFENAKQIIGGAFEVIKGIFQTVSALLKGDWSGVWEGIKTTVSGAWEAIKGIIQQGWNIIKTVFRLAGDALGGIFSGIWSGIKDLASGAVNGLIDIIKDVPRRLGALGGMFLDAGAALMGRIFEGFKRLGSIGKEIGENVFGAIARAINSGIDKINDVIPNSIGIGPAKIDLPDNPLPRIPGFARGTSFAPGGVALVGEQGPELVNLPRGSKVTTAGRTAAMLGGGGDVHVHISGFVGNEAQLAQAIERVLINGQRTTGRAYEFTTA